MLALEVHNVHAYYGHIHALKGISVTVEDGEIVTLIGGNGAGKSTTLKTISGMMRPREGYVKLYGEDLGAYRAHEIVSKGVVQVPEGRQVFAGLTVMENLEMGAFSRRDADGIRQDTEHVFQLFPRLKERQRQVAGTLSGGEQPIRALVRALVAKPDVLFLVEPSMGLAPVLGDTIFATLTRPPVQVTTIFIVAQTARSAFDRSTSDFVIQTGEVVLSDSAANLRANPTVQKSYLGIS